MPHRQSGAPLLREDDSLLPEETDPRDSPESPETDESDTVATPEGDNEYAPDQPLRPAPDGMQRTPAIDTNKI